MDKIRIVRLGAYKNSHTSVRHGNAWPRATIALLFGIVHVAGVVEDTARKTGQGAGRIRLPARRKIKIEEE
jgi:hypothetical protein